MLLGILLAFLILVCIALGGVVLLQRSEGGALGMGGGPSGFLTTRGAGDLLTRTTWVLAAIFFTLCLGLTILQGRMHKGASVVDRLRIDPMALDARPTPAPAPSNLPAAPVQDGFGAPLPQVNTVPAPAAAAVSAPPAGVPAPKPVAIAPAEKPPVATSAAKLAKPVEARRPSVTATTAPAPHAASTPPGTNTGPTDPVTRTVGGAPGPDTTTPGPRV